MFVPLVFRFCRWLLLALALVGVQGVHAQGSLPPVEVRDSIESSPAQASSQHVTTINAKAILHSTATSVAELLSTEGNLPLLSYFGNGRNASVDMRGMGVSAGSNVLVVVDGVRLNANDLSGPDLSFLSLDQIERIDIVRGGGSVREGSGAVGGVIRITTRRSLPAGGKQAKLQLRTGSDGGKAWALSGAARAENITATIQLNQDDSEGYRDNGGLNASGAALALQWSTTLGSVITDVHAKVSQHRDRYGLPGPVSLAEFQGSSQDRRSTQSPLDGGRTELMRYELGALLDWGVQGSLTWRTSLRERYNPYFIGVDANRSRSDQQNQILSSQWDHHLGYTLDGRWLGWQHSTTLGWDAMDGDYERWENGLFMPGSARLLGQASSQAFFVESAMYPHESVSVHAGLRWNKFTSKQRDQSYDRSCTYSADPIPVVIACTPYSYLPTKAANVGAWVNKAAEIGGNWQMTPTLLGSVNVSRNFRAPNIDELLLADSALGPQQGLNHEVSIKHAFSERLSWAATLFALENTGEIYYGVDASGVNTVNRNRSGRTQRRGVELDVNWQLSKQVHLHGQASYLVPRLAGNQGGIPLVARTTASLQVAWQPQAHWTGSLNGRYVGARPDGNSDSDPSLAKVPPYQVWDLGLRYTQRSAQWKVGIQNVFNEIYSTQVYSQTYYPMPEQQVYLTLDWSL